MKYTYLLLIAFVLSCEPNKKVTTKLDYSHPLYVTLTEFKEYGDIYLENCEDSCWIVKRHPHHSGICGIVALSIYDSCGRRIASGCTDGNVVDTIYHKCEPCDSQFYKYVFKEQNFIKYLKSRNHTH